MTRPSWSRSFVLLTAISILSLASCSGRDTNDVARAANPEPTNEVDTVGPNDTAFLDALSETAEETVQAIRERGALHVAVIESPESYAPTEPEERQGFDFRLAKDLARRLGVPLSVNADFTVQRFFGNNGEIPEAVYSDADVSYTPDGFREVDMFAAPLAILPWREQLASMIPIYPAGVSIVGRNADAIRTIADLDGLAVTVIEGEFQVSLLEGLMEEYGVSVTFVYRDQSENAYDIIRSGSADITLDGSIFVASGIDELGEMEVAPLSLSRVSVGWAVPKDEPGFQEVLSAYIEEALTDGTVARLWKDTHGVDFETYIRLIGLE